MKLGSTRRIRRLALCSLFTATALGCGQASAESPQTAGAASHSAIVDHNETPPVDSAFLWCGAGTHDSGPIAPGTRISRTSSTFDRTLAAVAASVSAGAGVSFEPLLGPLVMAPPLSSSGSPPAPAVVPFVDFSGETDASGSVAAPGSPGRWIADPHFVVDEHYRVMPAERETQTAKEGSLAEATSLPSPQRALQWLNEQLKALTPLEPIDAVKPQPSQAAQPHSVASAVSQPSGPRDEPAVVGSSPMIVTLAIADEGSPEASSADGEEGLVEEYVPYDLAQRDRDRLPSRLVAARPFCVRARRFRDDRLALWPETPPMNEALPESIESESQAVEPAGGEKAPQQLAEAQRTFGRWIDRFGQWASENAARKATRPQAWGRGTFELVESGHHRLRQVASAIAEYWSTPRPVVAPAGARLLARAGAIEAAVAPAAPVPAKPRPAELRVAEVNAAVSEKGDAAPEPTAADGVSEEGEIELATAAGSTPVEVTDLRLAKEYWQEAVATARRLWSAAQQYQRQLSNVASRPDEASLRR